MQSKGKKHGKNQQFGVSLMRNRFGKQLRNKDDSFLHTSELNDGDDWARLNLNSVTEQDSLSDFLNTAQLAGTEFTAERRNIQIIDPTLPVEFLSVADEKRIKQVQLEHQKLLAIPRKPNWNKETSAEELAAGERENFLEWRRRLAQLQEVEGIIMTPYEKNLEFWRQLWRVIERSDIVAQIVDARNPLLFRCSDLEHFVKEVGHQKQNMILINKADYLTSQQRKLWAQYFESCRMKVVFWSANLETERLKEKKLQEEYEENNIEVNEDEETEEPVHYKLCCKDECNGASSDEWSDCSDDPDEEIVMNNHEILSGPQLLEFFKQFHVSKVKGQPTVVGLVGYPNVGKSSSINALIQCKKTGVSTTPGHTKHFQTLIVDSELTLCDCPGLVMPTFVSTKAEMVISGILPIDQMRDALSPVTLITKLIPKSHLEHMYGIKLPHPGDGEDPNRHPTAYELLGTYSRLRGFMTHKGQPDVSRSARIILKHFVSGNLLYCHPPPGISDIDFKSTYCLPKKGLSTMNIKNNESKVTEKARRKSKPHTGVMVSNFDKKFFEGEIGQIGKKDKKAVQSINLTSLEERLALKPWKKNQKGPRKEKLRRKFNRLDISD